MIVRTPKRSRGDTVLLLNRERITAIAGVTAAIVLVAFAVGFMVGKGWSTSSPIESRSTVASLEQPIVPSQESPTSLASGQAESRLASTPAAAAEPVKPTAAVAPPSVARPAAASSATPRSSTTERRPATVTTTTARPAVSSTTASISAATTPVGKRYAIIANSIPIGDTPGAAATARQEAERRLAQLKTKGFREARIEEVSLANKGRFLRVIAMEANYPSVNVCLRDIAAMKRRGELQTGWPLLLGDAR